jgi:hypothetical protein
MMEESAHAQLTVPDILMPAQYYDGMRRGNPETAARCGRPTKVPLSPLAGKLFDENAEPLYVQGTVKGLRHYRYYVSRALVRGLVRDDRRGWRVAAPELERAVCAATRQILGDRAATAGAIEELGIEASRLPSIFKALYTRALCDHPRRMPQI